MLLKSIEKEPKDIRKMVKKILQYHFNADFASRLPQRSRTKQVKSWIHDLARKRTATIRD